MRCLSLSIIVTILLIAGCAQTQNIDSGKNSKGNQTKPSSNLSLDDLTLEEIKSLPFNDTVNIYLSLDIDRLLSLEDERDPFIAKADAIFSRLTSNSKQDQEISVLRQLGDDEQWAFVWKISDPNRTRKVVQKTGLILMTLLGGANEYSFGVMPAQSNFINLEQLFWILRASNSNHALPFLWLITHCDNYRFQMLAIYSFADIRTRPSLYAAWKSYWDDSIKLEVLQTMTGKDWDLKRLSDWISKNIKRIVFDSEGKIFFVDEFMRDGKMDLEYFLPDFDEEIIVKKTSK